MKIKSRDDLVLGIGLLLICSVLLTQLAGLSDNAAMFPRAVFIAGLILAVLFIYSAFRAAPLSPKTKKRAERAHYVEAALVTAAFPVMLLAEVVGLYTCTFVVILYTSLYVCISQYGFNFRKILRTCLYNILVIAGIYLIFSVALQVITPRGLFL